MTADIARLCNTATLLLNSAVDDSCRRAPGCDKAFGALGSVGTEGAKSWSADHVNPATRYNVNHERSTANGANLMNAPQTGVGGEMNDETIAKPRC